MKFYKDTTKSLEKVYISVRDKFFPELGCLRFLYIFRDGEMYDEDGLRICAQARKISNKERDIYHYDVEISADEEVWSSYTKKERRRQAYHELLHVRVSYDMDQSDDEEEKTDRDPKQDKDGRIVFTIEPHDIIIKRFKKELTKFGLSESEEDIRDFLNSVKKRRTKYKKSSKKSKKKKRK